MNTVKILFNINILKKFLQTYTNGTLTRTLELWTDKKVKIIDKTTESPPKYYKFNSELIEERRYGHVIVKIAREHFVEVQPFSAQNTNKAVLKETWHYGNCQIQFYTICKEINKLFELLKDCFTKIPDNPYYSKLIGAKVVINTEDPVEAENYIHEWCNNIDPEVFKKFQHYNIIKPVLKYYGIREYRQFFNRNTICGHEEWKQVVEHKDTAVCYPKITGWRCLIIIGDNMTVITDSYVKNFGAVNVASKPPLYFIGYITPKHAVYAHTQLTGKRYTAPIGTKMSWYLKSMDITTLQTLPAEEFHSIEVADNVQGIIFHLKDIDYTYYPIDDIHINFAVVPVPSNYMGKKPYIIVDGKKPYMLCMLMSRRDVKINKVKLPPNYNRNFNVYNKRYNGMVVPFFSPRHKLCNLVWSHSKFNGEIVKFKWVAGKWKALEKGDTITRFVIATKIFDLFHNPLLDKDMNFKVEAKIEDWQLIKSLVADANKDKVLTDGVYCEEVCSIDNAYPKARRILRGPINYIKRDQTFDVILGRGPVGESWFKAAINLLNKYGRIYILSKIGPEIEWYKKYVFIYNRQKCASGDMEIISCIKN